MVCAREVLTSLSQSLFGCWFGRGDDLDGVAVAQLVAQRDDHAVDARARAVVADLASGSRTRSRSGSAPLGSALHVALGREDVDLVAEQVDLDRLEELGRVLELLLLLHQLAQPGELARRRSSTRRACPPCTSSARRCRARRPGASRSVRIWISMRSPPRPDHRGVQRLVHVRLGQRDVVLEAARDRLPLRVARRRAPRSRRVAVSVRTRKAIDVVDLLERRGRCASSSGRSTRGAWRGRRPRSGRRPRPSRCWISFSTSSMYSLALRAGLGDVGRRAARTRPGRGT